MCEASLTFFGTTLNLEVQCSMLNGNANAQRGGISYQLSVTSITYTYRCSMYGSCV